MEYWLKKDINPSSKEEYDKDGFIAKNACEFTIKEGKIRLIDMLGHSNKAIELDKGASISFEFL